MAEKDMNCNWNGVITDKNDPNYGRTKVETFSRSMGFIRPVSNFNTGKYQEFSERNTFKEDKALTTGARAHEELLKKAA